MSGTLPANPADCVDQPSDAIELLLDARPRDLGSFEVRRALPAAARRTVGPFIFFDHFGPADLPRGTGLDVRPHPHIGLATVTYLFAGEIIHRDSLGYLQPIRPGDVNWMHAGRGIVHSERSRPEARVAGVHLHGIQSWVALPQAREEDAPSFAHYPQNSIPIVERAGAVIDVIAGSAFGARAPVEVASPTLYAHVRLAAGAQLPLDSEHQERAVYVAEGELVIGARRFVVGTMVVLRPGAAVVLSAEAPVRCMVLGGAPLDGPRHVYWNFVASDPARIERAKDDWRQGRFGKVPGDEVDFIPLPDR